MTRARMLSWPAAVAALMLASSQALAVEPWELILTEQMTHELGCKVIDVSNVRQFMLGESLVIDGHADCEDGRAYDFTRPKNHMRFELRLCQPVVC